jgi:ABC-type polar amino acid transport system ATPase subunit
MPFAHHQDRQHLQELRAFKVLDGLSMQVMPGEKLALIGPSGSGKTTILRILMTLERIDGGHIQIDGEQLYHMEAQRQTAAADERHLQGCARRSAWSSSCSTCFRTNASWTMSRWRRC